MPPEPPGWYHDPKRPGIRRYWDGDHWIDVDQVVDDHGAVPPAPRSLGERRIIRQRRPDDRLGRPDAPDAPGATGESEPQQD